MKLTGAICSAVAFVALQGVTTTARAGDQDAIIARLDALEKENAVLRQRLNRMEHAAGTSQRASPRAARQPNSTQTAELETSGGSTLVMDAHGQGIPPAEVYKNPLASNPPPHFELSGSLLFLQPGAGNLEYGTPGDPISDSNAQLGQSIAHAEFRSRLRRWGSLYAQRVQRHRIKLDAAQQFHECVLFGLADPNGGTALSDWPRS